MRRRGASWVTAATLVLALSACEDEIVEIDLPPRDAGADRGTDASPDGAKPNADASPADGATGDALVVPDAADGANTGDAGGGDAGAGDSGADGARSDAGDGARADSEASTGGDVGLGDAVAIGDAADAGG